jgi:hypothetical protein
MLLEFYYYKNILLYYVKKYFIFCSTLTIFSDDKVMVRCSRSDYAGFVQHGGDCMLEECEICGQSTGKLYTCKVCGKRFCRYCGSFTERLCLDCLGASDDEDHPVVAVKPSKYASRGKHHER